MTTATTYVHPDHHRAAIRAAHAETLRAAIDWLDLSDAFISTTDELVVCSADRGRELREPLHPDHLEPGVLRRQLIDLARRLAERSADEDPDYLELSLPELIVLAKHDEYRLPRSAGRRLAEALVEAQRCTERSTVAQDPQ